MRLVKTLVIYLLATATVIAAQGSSNLTPESQQLLSQLETQIKGTLLAVAENENRAGRNMDKFYYLVDLPAKQQANLGLVVDVNDVEKGYSVISVTPGSAADEVKITAGDRIVAINQLTINSSNHDKALMQLHDISPGKKLRLALADKDTTRDVELQVKGDYLPGIRLEVGNQPALVESYQVASNEENSEACGEVSVFFQPPATRDLYSAYIHKIDDKPMMRHRHSFRLPPGKHRIYLHELISDPFLTRRKSGLQKAKFIDVDIKPDTTYYFAAKFYRAKKFRTFKEEYWEPVIWRTKERPCKL